MNIVKIEQDSERIIDYVERIRKFALGIGYRKIYSEEDFIDKLYMETGIGTWIYELEIESTGNSSYGINAWLTVTDGTFFTYNLISLYRSAFRFVVNDPDRFMHLLSTLPDIQVSKFYDEQIELYLENWYNASIIETL